MNSIQDGILATYHNSLSWDQSFSILHNDQPVDLSVACGQPNSSTFSAPDQPKKVPNGLIYCFDITKFAGESGWSSLKKMIKDSLPGSDFIECRHFCALSLNSFRYTLHCNRYKMLETNIPKHYHPESFTQSGVRIESVKRTKTPGALKAFDAKALDYLLKPFSKARFAKSLEKFLQMGNNPESINAFKNESVLNPESANRVVLKVKNEIKIIPVSEIKYLEANDDYVNIYTKEGKFLKNKTLSFYEKSLDTSLFVRVHRSYLVNISEITKIEPYEKEGYMLKLRGGENIPVSKSGFPKLKLVLGI